MDGIDVLGAAVQFVSGPFPSPPYYKARFSNGRVWIELVAATFGDELENFATGNAISGATGEAPGQFMVQPPYANMSSAHEVFVPSTLDQVCGHSCWLQRPRQSCFAVMFYALQSHTAQLA